MRLLRLLTIFTLFFLVAFTFTGKREYPQDDFRSPINNTLRLAGTFGELRPNHFHAGIDIKGATGTPLFSIADGYVSRIKVGSGGYGQVLYIRHANGFTSVYAHMDRFAPELEELIRSYQYQQETFEVEIYPEKDQYSLKKGDQIGTMGMTGSAFGPHLHFEIRDSRTEKPINPLLFGFKVADNQPPKMHELRVYSINDQRETSDGKSYGLIKTKSGYQTKSDTLFVASDRVGFALKTYDHMDGVTNWNGIYSLEMYQDDSLSFQFEMETFAFNETRFLNAHLDYEEQVSAGSYFNRCHLLPGNELSIYNHQTNFGVIKVSPNRASKMELVVKDIAGNESRLTYWVKRHDIINPKPLPHYSYFLPYNQGNAIDNGDFFLYLPKGSLYENLYLDYDGQYEQTNNVYSNIHHIHDFKTPVHQYFDLGIRPVLLPDELRDKAFVAYCGKNNTYYNCGGQWDKGMLQTKVRAFGDYCIMTDTIPPRIQVVDFQRDMRRFSEMSFKITDNFPTARNIDDLSYRATVDGRWILMELDGKKDKITHRFDDRITPGQHQLRLVVRDVLGNERVFEREFIR
ncbi:MAG: peptidase M23 [Saprospiraceae bacterium]|nr:MAG: peptidase M23 [Saprospiraceae bacterium]